MMIPKLKKDTMSESDLQIVYDYPIYPTGSKVYTNKEKINTDNGQMGGTQWTWFYINDNKSFYFVSFGGSPD